MSFKTTFWIRFSIFNLMLVALLGLLMRYKILFEFPLLDQKSLQHSHSHFAFAGWVSHTLITLLIGFLQKHDTLNKIAFKKLQINNYKLLIFNFSIIHFQLPKNFTFATN